MKQIVELEITGIYDDPCNPARGRIRLGEHIVGKNGTHYLSDDTHISGNVIWWCEQLRKQLDQIEEEANGKLP